MTITDACTSLRHLIVNTLVQTAGCTDAELEAEPVCFVRKGEDHITINAEHPFCGLFADYYGEFQNNNGDPFIHPEIERMAEEERYELEWENPGSLAMYGDFHRYP